MQAVGPKLGTDAPSLLRNPIPDVGILSPDLPTGLKAAAATLRAMLPRLTAVHLHRFLSSGRSRPAVFGCVDHSGNPAGDYVLKLSAAMDTGTKAAANEIIASLLAERLGLLRPEPAMVQIHPDLIPWLSARRPEVARVIQSSAGLNFASKFLTDAAIWPIGRPLPDSMFGSAAHVFAFDALISNDDRRYTNPNVLVRGDDIFVIDHEAAFSFLYLVGGMEASWAVRNRRSLTDHVFYFQLRKQTMDLSMFTARLAQLGEAELETIVRAVPNEWRYDGLERISDHLKAARDHSAEFSRQVLERLA
jgi:hypothetical protein